MMTALYTVLDVMAAAPGVVESACRVLNRELALLDPEAVLALPTFEKALAHPNPAVRKLGFAQILRAIDIWTAASATADTMLAKVVAAVADEDVSVNQKCTFRFSGSARAVDNGSGWCVCVCVLGGGRRTHLVCDICAPYQCPGATFSSKGQHR